MERGYSVKIVDSSRELTPKEKVMFKDTSDCIRLDTATQGGEIIIKPVDYVKLSIHNEQSEDKDYFNYIYITADGTKYTSGSENLFNTFLDIWEDMYNSDEEWSLKIYRLPSKNFTGRDFITCSVI